ncbi:uncharacterized protein LOC124110961 isoform X1 [Haliotis rufescens]|uniref:uncharacterized protein LOC124110961 isoform X1 n=1 Tax=Haliotis rufescens TaxID=6454 RepID=UPI00201F73C7|nr:uncharacterized protein LOC124110961 isoform X1 [Haliotis rufescens]
MWSCQYIAWAILLFGAILGIDSASLAAERVSEAVSITLYRLEADDWSSKSAAFKTVVADGANVYCEAYPSACGFLYWDSNAAFGGSLVGENQVVVDAKNLKVNFYIQFHALANISSVSKTQFVLNYIAFKTIVQSVRLDIASAVGAPVTYVDTEFYGIPPANLANRVIIPVAVVVLLVIIVIAIALHLWNKRQKKNKKSRARRDLTSAKVTPIHTTHGATGKHADTHNNLNGSNVNNTEKGAHQMKEILPSTPQSHPQKLPPVNGFMEDETQHRNAARAVSVEDTEGEHRKDKKRKKKRKKRHHRDSESGYDHNQSDNENTRTHTITSQERHQYGNDVYDSDPC